LYHYEDLDPAYDGLSQVEESNDDSESQTSCDLDESMLVQQGNNEDTDFELEMFKALSGFETTPLSNL